jgi:phosphoenolpyruvate-protein kinase (PTS system EI component)/YHS domain-containing protein
MSVDKEFFGVGLSPGWAVGHLCIPTPYARPVRRGRTEPDYEVKRFRRHVGELIAELEQQVASLDADLMRAEADVVRAHLAMLQDQGFHDRVSERIHRAEHAAEEAVEIVLDEMAELMAQSPDPVLAERAADFRDLAAQLNARLMGEPAGLRSCVEGVEAPIVVVEELLPSMVLQARDAAISGFVVVEGTGLSHAAILAKSFRIPVLRVQSLEPLRRAAGRRVLLDADAGRLVIEPKRIEVPRRAPEPVAGPGALPLPARLWISVVAPTELDGLDWDGIEGIGLYRTEVLFMRFTRDFPGEEEQVSVYRRLFEAAGRRPVVVRTADLGGDKPVAHMSFGPERNPHLGLRAHRLYRFHPEILVTQVRAILRAAHGEHRLRLMFPMLETLDAWRFVSRLVEQAAAGLRADGLESQHEFERGVLVETPSAAWSLDEFLEVADFVGVGTNDLVQYFLAVERDALNVADFYQPEHPVVLRLLKWLAGRARRAGKPLSVCGEIAGDASFAPVLVGLGVENLSVAPSRLPAVRASLAGLSLAECRARAERCLDARDADEVRGLLQRRAPTEPRAAEGALGKGQAVDPVCGMIVRTANDALTLERGARRYYFCSARCLREFRRTNRQL